MTLSFRPRSASYAFAAALASAAAIACSSSGGGGGTSTPGDFASSFCALVAPCCGAQGLPSTGVTCEAIIAAAPGESSFNSASAAACLSAAQAASKRSATWCATPEAGVTSACGGVFGSTSTGTAKPGADCTLDSDCAAGPSGSTVTCITTFVGSATTSTCQVQIPGKAGSKPCIGTSISEPNGVTYTEGVGTSGAAPATGYICAQSDGVSCDSTTLTCTSLLAVGAACVGSDCVADAYCDFGSGKCVASQKVGGACSGAQSGECAAGTYCDATSMTCRMTLANGTPCTSSDTCASGDCNNGTCSAATNLGLSVLCGSG